jgi:hypothetical protein
MLLVVVMLSVEVPDEVIEGGEKAVCIPEGAPLDTSDTAPVNPFSAEILTVKLVLLPAATVCKLGSTESEKLGLTLVLVETKRLIVALWLTPPLAPHSVTV